MASLIIVVNGGRELSKRTQGQNVGLLWGLFLVGEMG